jgi:hypothetical protein
VAGRSTGALGRGREQITWFVVGTAAGLFQMALAVPVFVVGATAEGGPLGALTGVALAVAWGVLTLFAAWAWVFGRWRIVAAPIVTLGLLWVVANTG